MLRSVLLVGICTAITAINILPTVKIPNGYIQGTVQRSYRGKPYMLFDGIPYARPPIGHLRFEVSQPAESWNKTLMANRTTACIQIVHVPNPAGGISKGTEDCVLVFIHGGAFSYGSASSGDGKYLMDRDVILVSVNYRLGIFGFLSTQDATVPGNLGFKDQVLALKWVRDNIAYFGGNPNSVTLSGLSVGATSVHYHILSPLSKGLFHKAIAMSGSALRTLQATPRKKAMTLGKLFNCPLVSTRDMITCLKRVPEGKLLEATRSFRPWLYNPTAVFLTVIDKWSEEPFLPEHPIQIYKTKQFSHVPFISSSVANEGLYPGAELLYNKSYLKVLNNKWSQLAPVVLMYEGQIPEIESIETTKLIRAHYFSKRSISKRTFRQLIQLFGDRFYDYGFAKSLRLHSQFSSCPVYAYRFCYTPEKVPSSSDRFTRNHERLGISHGDDRVFLFGLENSQEQNRTLRDAKMTDFFLDLYVRFMQTSGIIFDKWRPVINNHNKTIQYLHIEGPEFKNMQMGEGKIGNPDFWDKITLETH